MTLIKADESIAWLPEVHQQASMRITGSSSLEYVSKGKVGVPQSQVVNDIERITGAL